MDIENIVEKRLNEAAKTYGKCLDMIDMKPLASLISSDIKKELKLVASGEIIAGDIDLGLFGNVKISFKFLHHLDADNWKDINHSKGNKCNIYIEEIDNG